MVRGPRRRPLMLRASRAVSVWCGGEEPRQSFRPTGKETDRQQPLWSRRSAGRRHWQPEKFVINIHLHTAVSSVSSKSKHFRFYLVIYHGSFPVEGNQGMGNVEFKRLQCVHLFLFSVFHFSSWCCQIIFIDLHLVSLASQRTLY